jgi:hypothetical protein
MNSAGNITCGIRLSGGIENLMRWIRASGFQGSSEDSDVSRGKSCRSEDSDVRT